MSPQPMHIENTLTDDNRAALASLIGRGERDEPFLFVGRERIFEDIEEQLRQVNEKGMSFDNAAIIQGPPGSGKTSVLRELEHRYDAAAQVIPVHLDGHQLSDGFSVAKTFLKSSGFERLLQQQATQKWIHGHLGDKHIGLKAGYETTTHAFRQRFKDGEFVWDVLEECLDVPPGTTFLVLIDEAQQVMPDTSSDINRIAITLARGKTENLRTVTVFAGLPDTGSRLSDVGVSPRLTTDVKHSLGSLSGEMTRIILDAFWSHPPFGFPDMPRSTRETFNDAIAYVSEGYPRHLQSYLRGIASAFLCETPAVTLKHVLDIGHTLRIDFYKDVISRVDHPDYIKSIGACLRTARPLTVPEVQMIAVDEYGMPLAEAQSAFKKALHCGLVEIDDSKDEDAEHLRVPIPSLQTYFEQMRGRDSTIAVLERNVWDLLESRGNSVDLNC